MTGTFSFEEALRPADPLANAVLMAESGGRQDAVSPKGATGLMQLMPGTARDLGVDPKDPVQNVEGGARYLDQMMRKYGDETTALMAYNWGPGNVDKWIAGGRKGAVPAETRTYVQRVLSRLNPVGTAQAAEPPQAFSVDDAYGAPSPQAATFSFEEAASPDAFSFEEAAVPSKSLLNTTWEGLTSGVRAGVTETGESLTGPFAEGAPHREPGYLGKILETPISEGWSDPNWWAAQLSYGVGKTAPSLATGIVGTAAGAATPIPGGALIGGAAGFGLGAAVQALAPAYKEARARGLDHDGAVNEALAKSGIAGSFNAVAGAIPGLSILGKAASGAFKKPISEALLQVFGVQPGIGAGQQIAEAGVEGRVPTAEELVQGWALNTAQGAGPVAAQAGARGYEAAQRRVGEIPGAPSPDAQGPETGSRHVLGLEEQVADSETGQTTKTVTPADVTVQGYDPATGLVTVTRDADGAQLGPMSVDDFNALRRDEQPRPPPVDDWIEPAETPTAEDVLARDQALDVARDRGFAEPLEGGQMPQPIPEQVEPAGEVPFAPGLPEETGKRPFMTRDPRPTTPELPGLVDAENRLAFEMDVAEEADRVAARSGKAPPQDLVSFLAENGGMRDEGGELRSMDLDRQLRPGQTKLIREDGDYQDAALERAIEGGFLPEGASVRDLLDAIDDTARGRPVYSQMDLGDVEARRVAAEARAERSAALRERAAELGIDPKNLNDRDLRRQIKEYESAEMGETPTRVTKTPEGAYELKDTDGEPLGAYPSKKRAEEAAVDKRATNDAVEGMTLRQAAEQERAAKEAVDQHKGKGPPKDIEKQIALLPDPPSSRVRMKDLGSVEAKGIFPRTLAMQDRPFARLYKPVQKREEAQTRNYRDFFWQVKPLGALTKPSRDQVYKAAALARLQGRNIVPSGARLVIKNGDKAVIDPDTEKAWVNPGETIKLTKEETEAYFALKSTMQTVWRRYNEAVVRNLGYDGDMKALRAAMESPQAAAKFLENASKPETARQALDLLTELKDQERAGYIPFQRRGDVMITVMPKAEKGLKTSAGDLGGKVEPLHVEFVDTDTIGKKIAGRKFTQGDYGKKVAERVKALKKQFPEGEVMEPRYISEVRQEDMPLPALEKLVSGLANKNPDLRDSLYNEFMKDVYNNAKAGWRKQSANVPGFSTDFDRMVTEYLHHTARVLPMIESRNEIADARAKLMGSQDSKGKSVAPEGSQSVRRYADKWLRSVDDPGGDFAGLRKAGFLWWLWASPSSAIINLTQTPLVTIPTLGKWGGTARAFLETNKLAAQILRPDKMMFGKKNWGTDGGKIVLNIDNVHVSEKEKALLREWERDGTLQAQVTSDMLGNNIGKSPAFRPMSKMAQKAYEAGASLFGAAEVTNRAIAGLTAYRLALQPGNLAKAKKVYKDNQLFQEQFGDKVTPENLGKWAILETQFQGGKVNTPEIMRGIGAPLTQFKKFTANYLSLLNRQFRHEGAAGKVASTMMLASLVAAAGIKGLPFIQDIADAADWATETATGINPHIEMTVRNWLRDGLEGVGGKYWGDVGSEMLMNGPSRHLTGMDLGQRFGQGDLVPSNPADMFGPLAGAIAQGADAAKLYKSGQNYQATAKLLPKGPGNIVSAVGLQEEGTTTAAGNRVMQPSEYSDADVAKQALGFSPANRSRRYENIFDLSKIDADARRATAGFYRRLANSLNLAEQHRAAGDMSRAGQYMDRFQADLDRYLKNIEDPNRPEWVKFKISRESLKREIANAMDWSRRFTKSSPKPARLKIMEMMERMARSVGEPTDLEGEDE